MSHLRPTAPIAENALLPEDPALAMAVAQDLLEEPLMSNHAHGLWGYSGQTATGHELTIQSSGLGGPSLAIVARELAAHGARRLIRIGTCRALDQSLQPGACLLVTTAMGSDGTSLALGATGPANPEPALQVRLGEAGLRRAKVVSADLDLDSSGAARPDGAAAADLATAALFALGAAQPLATASLLIVTAPATAGGGLGDEQLRAETVRAGRVAAEALADAQTER